MIHKKAGSAGIYWGMLRRSEVFRREMQVSPFPIITGCVTSGEILESSSIEVKVQPRG